MLTFVILNFTMKKASALEDEKWNAKHPNQKTKEEGREKVENMEIHCPLQAASSHSSLCKFLRVTHSKRSRTRNYPSFNFIHFVVLKVTKKINAGNARFKPLLHVCTA